MPWYEDFDRLISQTLPSLSVSREEPMAGHTTFRIGGPARRMVFPSSPEELSALLTLAEKEGWPWMPLGNGSNLLVRDEGLDLLVIATGKLEHMELMGDHRIRAWAGVSLARLAVFAMEHGLEGLAFAHGIPGRLAGSSARRISFRRNTARLRPKPSNRPRRCWKQKSEFTTPICAASAMATGYI